MKRSEIRDFLKAGVNALTPPPEFGSGRLSEFASLRSHTYPSVWQNIKPVNVQIENIAPLDNWEIELTIAQLDKPDSTADQYEQIIDESDYIAQKLIYQYRNVTTGYKKLTISEVTRTPFVKKLSPDCISGVVLAFTIVATDTTNVC